MTLSAAEVDAIGTTLQAAFEPHAGGSVTPVLEEFGWTDMLSAEAAVAVPLVFELLGSSGTTSRALSDVMLHGLGSVPGHPTTVVIPTADDEAQAAGRMVGAAVAVDGVCLEDPGPGPAALAVRTEGGVAVAVVSPEELRVRDVGGADLWVGLRRVEGSARCLELLPPEVAAPAWASAIAWGRRALAAQLVGVVDASLRLATEHATNRFQFKRPVGTFQAVQHRLADVLIALEAARAALAAAGERPDPLPAMVAKSLAGVAAQTAAANCLQVLAGVGFTWEHPLHRYHKRGLVLDRLLGSSAYLPGAIGEVLIRLGEAPRLVEL